MTTQLSTATIERQVQSFLQSYLLPEAGSIDLITAAEQTSEQGEDLVMINITFAASEQPLDPDQLADIPFLVAQKLEAAGEHRFCHVRIHFADRQALRGW
jgi:hypothetical protein